jgi:hypothetical protein
MPKTFDVGRMRQRVSWQVWDGSTDTMNEPLDSGFITQGSYWAEVIPLGGSEKPVGKQDNAASFGTIKMRNVGPIKPSDRFLFEDTGRILDLTSVVREGERNAYLLIEFTELKVPQ